MGILNVTPDSFSDGGRHLAAAAAIQHGLLLSAQGAAMVDVGGESTRPGASRTPAEVEMERVLPVVQALTSAGVSVSIDTTRACVAEAAVAAGARMINDVSGGLADPQMAAAVSRLDVPYVVMHWRGHSAQMQRRASYGDVVAEVRRELSARVSELVSRGVKREQIVLDPGIGFAKHAHHNWRLLESVDTLAELGHALLVGVSRKSFLASSDSDPELAASMDERDVATAAAGALLAGQVSWLRVHDVRANVLAVRVAEKLGHFGSRPGTYAAPSESVRND
ncbi:dihydropteroate synthase [Nocardioides sp. NPDC127503]|uniref:dihydropteroate synthase n=1 Tax=Nocardioides sp. NPDC127503 TaxID=3154516 RepID=UPI00331A5759